jgi:hypothetical protein
MISLKKANNALSNANKQLAYLNSNTKVTFSQKLQESQLLPLTVTSIDTLQINLGKMCNQL